jgi:exoribonuclease-2
MNSRDLPDRVILQRIAHRVMLEAGFLPDFSSAALDEVGKLQVREAGEAVPGQRRNEIPDLRSLPWASIDNDDSRDLDQLTVAEPMPADATKIRVAIADVAAFVGRNPAIDAHAAGHHHPSIRLRRSSRCFRKSSPRT